MRDGRAVVARVVAVAVWALVGSVTPAAAQETSGPGLTEADAAALQVATVAVLRDSLDAPWEETERHWIGAPRGGSYSAAEWDAIAGALAGAVLAGDGVEVFDCPPGVEVSMPHTSCPIRDGGLFVRFGPLERETDGSVTTAGWITQTDLGSTWGLGLGMRFVRRADGAWRLAEIPWRSVT